MLAWLQHNIIGSGELAVIALDSNWQAIVQGFLPGISFYRDEHDSLSSLPSHERCDDLTALYSDAIVLTCVATKDELDIHDAMSSMTNKFQEDAYKMFPESSSTIIGVCSSPTLIVIFKIVYNRETRRYQSSLFPNAYYRVQHLQGRINFLVDILKLMKWVKTVTRPIESFHLVPNVRRQTSSQHYVTWNGIAIIKEFTRKPTIDLTNIKKLCDLRLLNVEHGDVISDNTNTATIRINRIGKPLLHVLAERLITYDKAIEHIEAGIAQLREIGLAHGDIQMRNIFVDVNGVVFLSDLEYCAPLGSIIPPTRRPREGRNVCNVSKIEDFDQWKLSQLRVEIAKL